MSAPVAAMLGLWTVVAVLRVGGAFRRGGAFVFTLAVIVAAVFVATVCVDLARGQGLFRGARRVVCLVVLVVVPLVFDVGIVDTFNVAKFTVVLVAAVLVLVTWVGERLVRGRPVAWRIGLQWPLAGLVVWTALATATGITPRASLVGSYGSNDGLVALVAFAVLLLAFAESFSVEDVRRLLMVLWFAAGGLIGLYGLLQLHDRVITWGGRWDWVNWKGQIIAENAIWSTLGNPNHLGGAIAILLPVGIAVVLTAGSRREGILAVAVGVPLVAELVYAASAGAWLAALASLPVTAALLAPEIGVHRSRAAKGAVGLVGLTVAAALALGPVGGLAGQVKAVFDLSGASTAAQRLGYWDAALAMAADRPLVGVGPDAYHLRFASHQSADFVADNGSSLEVNGPHNLFLSQLVGGGIPALVLFAALLALASMRSLGAWRRLRHLERSSPAVDGTDERCAAARTSRMVLAGITGGLVAYVVQASFNVQQIALSLLFWALLGMLAAVARSAGVPDSRWPNVLLGHQVAVPRPAAAPARRTTRDQVAPVAAALVVGVLGAVVCVQALRPYRADRRYFVGLRWQATADFLEDRDPARAPSVRQRAVAEFTDASEINPWESTFPAARARALYALGFSGGEDEGALASRRTLLLEAAESHEQALDLAPGSWRLLNSRAEVFIRLSEIDPADRAAAGQAETALTRSIDANPRNARSTLLLALLLDRDERPAEAAAVVDRSLSVLPRSPELLRLGAKLRQRAGDQNGSDELWRRLLDVVPGDPEAEKALARLGS